MGNRDDIGPILVTIEEITAWQMKKGTIHLIILFWGVGVEQCIKMSSSHEPKL